MSHEGAAMLQVTNPKSSDYQNYLSIDEINSIVATEASWPRARVTTDVGCRTVHGKL
jgi:hypothetical protein